MSGRLDRLLRPRSLAFVGGRAAELAIDACRSFGFSGNMWGVNPRRELRGVPTVASAADLPPGVDAVFVGVERTAAVEVVRQLAAGGAGAAVCHASGFAETGEQGAALHEELVEAAAPMPLLGPNCYGVVSALVGAALWPDVHGLARCDSGVVLLSQSGNIALNLTMARRTLDVAWVMTLGNQADVGVAEAFEAAVGDEAVTGVGLCVEALDDVERFAAAALAAHQRGLPVVALKLGASPAAGAMAITHTASLVGDDAAHSALFERLRVHRAHTVPELLDMLGVLCVLGPLAGDRLVSLSCSGGEAALVADRARSRKLSFPAFGAEHKARVDAALDGRAAVTNPLDYHTFIWGEQDRLERCFGAALGEPGGAFDAALLMLDFPAEGLDRSRWWPTLRAFAAACNASATPGLVAATMAENLPDEARTAACGMGLASCGDTDTALAALEAAAAWGAVVEHDSLWPAPARGDASEARAVAEHEAKPRLAAAGIAVPTGEVVAAPLAADAADRIGYPVVVKALGAVHKTDAGAVVVGLGGPHDVDAAARRLAPDGDGAVLVESCVDGAVAELLVGVRSAPPVGMLLTLGAGGVLAELLDDTASLLLPVARTDVLAALQGLRVWKLLNGYRGQPPAAVDAAVEAVCALARLVRDDPSIIEAEINPLIVTPDRAVAADALLLVNPGGSSG